MNPPLQPLAPAQRLAWLVNHSLLRCKRSEPAGHFLKGSDYAITTETARIQFKERRARRDGITEPVTFTGHELLVRLKDEKGNWHRCLPNPTATHELIHDFAFLVQHFHIPDVPDIAKATPKQFAAMKRRLKMLES